MKTKIIDKLTGRISAARIAAGVFALAQGMAALHAGAATVNSGSVSTIIGVQAGLCLGIKGDSTAAGALLQSQNCSGSNFQKWKFVKDSTGYYQIINVGSGLCIDVTGGSTSNGTNMQQWGCGAVDYQRWNPADQGNGQFAILSKYNGLALDVYDSSMANGARIVQWTWLGGANQKWTFPTATLSTAAVGPASGSVITLKGVHAGNCIGVKGSSTASGATLQSQGCSGSTFQQWRAQKDSNGDYDLINVGSGQCMDVPGASTAGGAVIQQWNCSGGAWQKWRFNNDGAGHYSITSKSSGLALDVLNSSTANGADIIQWTYRGATNQQWIASGASSSGNSSGPIGFGVGTSGGKGGATTTVTSCSALKSALASTSAAIINIPDNTTIDCRSTHTVAACKLSCPAYQDSGKTFYRIPVGAQTCQELGASTNTITNINVYDVRIDVKSNKTLQGLGKNSKIVGASLNLSNASNVIVRNLTLENINPHVVEGGDGITLENSRYIWINHVKTRMISDGHVDIKNSQNVTLSWNHFDGYNTYVCGNQHHYTMLLQDSKATLHHNFWNRTSGRNPKIDGANARVHLFNNYWLDITYFSIGTGNAAQALIENNYFANSAKPHWNTGGYMSAKGNVYTGVSATDPERDSGNTVFSDVGMYPYAPESASGLPSPLSTQTGPQ